MDYVRLTTIAAILGVTTSWLRGLVYQRVMDDERENPAKGSPYVMHVRQVFQAIVAMKMRAAGIGYNTIRLAIDGFEIDNRRLHRTQLDPTDEGMILEIRKSVYLLKARGVMKKANEEEERAAA